MADDGKTYETADAQSYGNNQGGQGNYGGQGGYNGQGNYGGQGGYNGSGNYGGPGYNGPGNYGGPGYNGPGNYGGPGYNGQGNYGSQSNYNNNQSGYRSGGPYGTPSTQTLPNGNKKNNKAPLIAVLGVLFLLTGVLIAVTVVLLRNDKTEEAVKAASSSVAASSESVEEKAAEPEETKAETEEEETEEEAEEEVETTPTEPAEELISVPNVKGKPMAEAQENLTAQGFQVVVEEMDSENVEAGFVISQSPTGEEQMEKNGTVTIYVAKSKAAETTTMYVAAGEYLTLRESPSTSAAALVLLQYNETVQRYSINGDFSYVEYKGMKGYVLTRYLSASPNPTPIYDTPSSTPSTGDTLYCCASDYATLRSSTSRSSGALATITTRGAVQRISDSGEWYYVSYNGVKGYVLKAYFSTDPNAPLNYGSR